MTPPLDSPASNANAFTRWANRDPDSVPPAEPPAPMIFTADGWKPLARAPREG